MTWSVNILENAVELTATGVYQGNWNKVILYIPTSGMNIRFPLQKSIGAGAENEAASFAVKNADATNTTAVLLGLHANEVANGCLYESPYTHEFISTDTNLVVPASLFGWVYSATNNIWFLSDSIYPTPKMQENELATNTLINATWTSLLSLTVTNYGLHSFIYNAEYEWISPGGNPTLDFSTRLQVNGVDAKVFNFYEDDKPSNLNVNINFPIWTENLNPSDSITIDARNDGSGVLTALGAATNSPTFMQLTGPFF